jgi:TonB family protein
MFSSGKLLGIAFLSLALGNSLLRADQSAEVGDAEPVWLATPAPRYPVNAVAQRASGTGRFQLFFDTATGDVIRVGVEQSTGYKILDDAAISGLSKWRVKPHTYHKVLVPFAFHLGSMPDDSVYKRFQEACRYATYTPLPKAPRRASHDYARLGNGWYQLTIDTRTGRVTDVKVVDTTRSAQLDDAARKTFLQWRFQPNTVWSVTLPAFF